MRPRREKGSVYGITKCVDITEFESFNTRYRKVFLYKSLGFQTLSCILREKESVYFNGLYQLFNTGGRCRRHAFIMVDEVGF